MLRAPCLFATLLLFSVCVLLDGQTALITGSGRGIGRSIARLFAAEGASVFLTARTEPELAATAAGIAASGGRAAYVAADLANEADCLRAVSACRERFGTVHILVNNAGVYSPLKPVEEITPEQWGEVLAVNLRSYFLLMRLVLPEMYARGSGVILNLSSLSAKAAFPWSAPYAASKAGVLGLTRAVAAEAAPKGVRVNAICPGPVTETRMSQELVRAIAEKLGRTPEEQLLASVKGILQARSLTAAEIARAALFLCSDRASAITGQAVNVDGGAAFY
jgi:NAD(P)-dependent dehydrogenase (short-subunit alcohol dehydrogenase family)